MILKYLFAFFVLFFQISFGQEFELKSILNHFQGKSSIDLPIPFLKNQKIEWTERKSSLSSEGIKTFVGYIDNQMIGVVSIYQNEISGNVSFQGKNFSIETENGKILIKEDKTKGECGVCKNGSCGAKAHSHEHTPVPNIQALRIDPNQIDDIPEIYTDGILRLYRLAILVDYSKFSDVATAKRFWAETEIFLNEVYMRDLSIRFEVVNNEKLIRQTAADMIFNNQTSDFITDHATKEINKLIGSESYDVGIVYAESSTRLNGSAGPYFAYANHTKAGGFVSVARPTTVAHELGHMFGSMHTFTTGGADTMNTEPARGQSVMSYNHELPRDFFSLPSVFNIRKGVLNSPDYYTDTQRKNAVGPKKSNNIIYGTDTKNQPPIINRSKIKKFYNLPQGSYFQFDINAKDPDNHTLLYMAHQADILMREPSYKSRAIVRSAKPSPEHIIPFYPQYELLGNTAREIEHSAPPSYASGEYTFWLGVSDAGIFLQDKNATHATRYDMVPTKVNFVSGTPFKITSTIKNSYTSGEKIRLNWSVDNAVFSGTKVRILLSNDLGKSFKYVLLPETENDGEAEITLPPVEIGKIQHSPNISSFGGMIKIEVIDHIAVAISENNPQIGGFEVKKSAISFENLPPQFISTKENELPSVPTLEATTTCTNHSVSIIYKGETQNGNILTRSWEATDQCSNKAIFIQYIEVKKAVNPLRFVGNLPENKHISCLKAIDSPADLKVEGGTSPQISFTQTKVQGDYDNYTLKRTWIATDTDAEPIMHTQMVVVHDSEKPVFVGELPQNKIVKNWGEIQPQITLTATDNCDSVRVEKEEKHEVGGNGKIIAIRIWKAVDKSNNEARHEQRITIDPDYVAPTTPPLAWVTTSFPENKTVSCASEIPSAQNPQTTGGQGTTSISVSEVIENKTCDNRYTLKRIYTATNGIETISRTQTIIVNDTTKPAFVENLPSDISIEEGNEIPSQANLTASDNCGTASVESFSERNGNQIIYKWVAKDLCGNETSHTQTITILPKTIAPIIWTSTLPQNIKVSCGNRIPNAENLTATGGEGTLTISHNDVRSAESCANQLVIARTYTATDGVRSIQHEQKIEVNDTTKPEFVENLPSDISIKEGEAVPLPMTLTATDNCGTASVESFSERNGNQIIYKWIAKDECSNETTHTQTITINPKIIVPSVPSTPTNPQNEEIIIYNGVSTQKNSENYLRINDNLMQKEIISVEIFNEMGQRIYKNEHYGKNGKVFRGYANEKGVFRKEKPLPQGTYFYIIQFKNGNQPNKAGYLFVK